MEHQYRSCTLSDIDAVLDLWRSHAHGGSTNSADAIEIRLRRDPELFILAWDGDVLVGTIIGGWDGWRANIYRLAVRHEYRRRGIATELVRRVEAVLRSLGAKRIYALAVLDSPEANPFWTARGYEFNTFVTPLAKTLESIESCP